MSDDQKSASCSAPTFHQFPMLQADHGFWYTALLQIVWLSTLVGRASLKVCSPLSPVGIESQSVNPESGIIREPPICDFEAMMMKWRLRWRCYCCLVAAAAAM
jgi:hypothetical protein